MTDDDDQVPWHRWNDGATLDRIYREASADLARWHTDLDTATDAVVPPLFTDAQVVWMDAVHETLDRVSARVSLQEELIASMAGVIAELGATIGSTVDVAAAASEVAAVNTEAMVGVAERLEAMAGELRRHRTGGAPVVDDPGESDWGDDGICPGIAYGHTSGGDTITQGAPAGYVQVTNADAMTWWSGDGDADPSDEGSPIPPFDPDSLGPTSAALDVDLPPGQAHLVLRHGPGFQSIEVEVLNVDPEQMMAWLPDPDDPAAMFSIDYSTITGRTRMLLDDRFNPSRAGS